MPTWYPPADDGPGGSPWGTGPGARAGSGPLPLGASNRWGVARVLAVAVIALGLLNFIWGFLPELSLPRTTTTQGSLSVFSIGPAYVPILLLVAGLLAMTAFLPGEERTPFAVAAVSSGGAIGAIVSLGTQDAVSGFGQVSKGVGAILLVIFGIIQAVVALTAFVIGSGVASNPRAGRQSQGTTGPGVPASGPTPAAFSMAGPYPAQSYPGQPSPAQEYPGQEYPGQPYPVQGWPTQAGAWGAETDSPARGHAGWGPAGQGAVQGTTACPAGPGKAPRDPSRSTIPRSTDARSTDARSTDARSADTDPHGIPLIDPAVPPAAGSVTNGPGQPSDDRPPTDTSADRYPTRDS